MSLSAEALIQKAIDPKSVRLDGNLTKPRTYGVYDISHKSGATRRYRFGNYPVRMHELLRDFGSCKLIALYKSRDDAVVLAALLNHHK